jgi:Mg-chelatase subunit ChlD/HEAT repeat protein
MNDLQLWKWLRAATLGPRLAEELRGLARLPLHQRTAFLGTLDRALLHPEPEVRAGAVLCLGGASGILAWKRLVACLKDPAPTVRRAAVEALWHSAHVDPARWIHALFHLDAGVRAQALEQGPPPGFRLPFPLAVGPCPAAEAAATSPPGRALSEDDLANVQSLSAQVEEVLNDPGAAQAFSVLCDFLSLGTGVSFDLRQRAAFALARLDGSASEEMFVPILLQNDRLDYDVDMQNAAMGALVGISSELVQIAAQGTLALGAPGREKWLTAFLEYRGKYTEDETALALLLTEATDTEVRRWARDNLPFAPTRAIKLIRLARVFAWGLQMGRYLTGEPFAIEMITGEMDMGYTRLRRNRIYITPRPILLGERFGSEVVRGLILHEYGHHLFHKGPGAEDVWHQADADGLGRLLNLVADEHLERNLRQRSSYFGNLLKTLASYAFQHSLREIPVEGLLGFLGARAALVLPQTGLGAARKFGHVVLSSGRLLQQMEAAGYSFARFLRALRLGLGNRSGDPKVAQGLALFRHGFRKATMPQLLDIARQLRDIFGQETNLLEHLSMEKALAVDESDWPGLGEGISPAEVSQAAQGLLESRRQKRCGTQPGGTGLNLGPEEQFSLINNIQPVHHDPARHAEYARRVARAARLLRQYFADLGLALRPERHRLQGRLLDRSRLPDRLVRGDPRLLIARKQERVTDLFLGVLIDCSGSMAGPKMEKARLFGTLLAEAVKDHPGIDLRIFGFEDTVIWDAGNARRCAAHALNAGGGNNDAAALWHAYQVARASRRKARLLVMISDGLPAECTVAALRGLVNRLTRLNYCCAQVAVQPLAEICFPHYVVVADDNLDAAVHKFGDIVMRLVGKVLGT